MARRSKMRTSERSWIISPRIIENRFPAHRAHTPVQGMRGEFRQPGKTGTISGFAASKARETGKKAEMRYDMA
jgi:hypothetical protein